MKPCPICAEPTDGAATLCPTCGWRLRSETILGWADDAGLDAAERAMRAAESEHDVRAAVRSGATRAEAARLGLRGGEPDESAWAAVTAAVGDADADGWDVGEEALLALLARLVDGTSRVVHVVGVHHAHVAHQRLTADEVGFPVLDGGVTTLDWSAATVSGDPLRCRFQLAGGVGAQAVDRDGFDRALAAALPRLDDGECVLVGPEPGWTLLDRAQDVVRRVGTVTVSITAGPAPFDLGEIVADALRAAPLPCDYDVLLQRLDPTDGTVEIVTRRMFAAGSRNDPGEPRPVQRLTVHGSPVGNAAALVPVVARTGPDPARWRVVAAARTNLPAGASAHVQFDLTGPDRVEVTRIDGVAVVPTGPVRLDALIASVPDRITLAPPLDLVCAVELCGAPDAVHRRLAVVDRLLELIEKRHTQLSAVRFGVLGYLDHRDRPTQAYESESALVGTGALGSAEAARTQLRTWPGRPPLRDSATAVEDALAKAAALEWTAAPTAERVLVLVGQRPPSVPGRGGDGPIAVCPDGTDWAAAAQRLSAQRVRIVAVLEPPSAPRPFDGEAIRAYAGWTWQQLVGHDRLPLDARAAESLAADLTRRADIPPEAFPLGLAAPPGAAPDTLPDRPVSSGERTTR